MYNTHSVGPILIYRLKEYDADFSDIFVNCSVLMCEKELTKQLLLNASKHECYVHSHASDALLRASVVDAHVGLRLYCSNRHKSSSSLMCQFLVLSVHDHRDAVVYITNRSRRHDIKFKCPFQKIDSLRTIDYSPGKIQCTYTCVYCPIRHKDTIFCVMHHSFETNALPFSGNNGDNNFFSFLLPWYQPEPDGYNPPLSLSLHNRKFHRV